MKNPISHISGILIKYLSVNQVLSLVIYNPLNTIICFHFVVLNIYPVEVSPFKMVIISFFTDAAQIYTHCSQWKRAGGPLY